jgi:hypothetical protein
MITGRPNADRTTPSTSGNAFRMTFTRRRRTTVVFGPQASSYFVRACWWKPRTVYFLAVAVGAAKAGHRAYNRRTSPPLPVESR